MKLARYTSFIWTQCSKCIAQQWKHQHSSLLMVVVEWSIYSPRHARHAIQEDLGVGLLTALVCAGRSKKSN
eukprot:1157265-Pelagomonas_calceolata.AAC.2